MMPLAVSSAVLIGIAYPIPSTDVSEYFTVFIPITSPLPFSKAPPLLPGLMAALVWSNVIVLSVNNECKELLLILGQTVPQEIKIHCVNLSTKGKQEGQHFTFTREQEQCSQCNYTDSLDEYLYEPNASLLKAGAFKSLSSAFPIRKLHPNSHLYTSDTLIDNFPGRIFRIVNQCSFNKKESKECLADLKKANITIRNFPATVAELRKRFKLSEGGDTYLFASTLNNEQKVLIRCEKIK